jgi:Na+/proline symporter
MVLNPTVKPKVATAGLVLTSTAVLIGLVLFLVYGLAAELNTLLKISFGCLLLVSALLAGGLWWKRVNHRRAWLTDATERWRSFDNAKLASGTTTEVTLLSVDAVQPTGSWVTILWNRFNHVQPAWIEALPEPIWPGAILLIAPDPAQVMPSAPWPETYFIRAADCLAWAPGDGRPAAKGLLAPEV